MPRKFSTDFDADQDDDPDADSGRPSKTRVKKAMLELQQLGVALMDLPESQLDAIEMDDRLREGLAELRRIRAHSAHKRQIKYVGKLLRDADTGPLRQALATRQANLSGDADRQHQAEAWRERLLEDESALEQWIGLHPGSDTRQFRALVGNARREQANAAAAAHSGGKPQRGRSYRDLFRHLRNALKAQAEAEPADDTGDN